MATYRIPEQFGITSISNSTTATLAGAATFTGTGEQNDFSHVGVMSKSDVSGTLYFDFSNDGTNWDSTFPVSGFSCAAGIAEFHTAVKLGRYFRIRYVNDSSAQTYFRLTTYYANNYVPSVAPLNQSAGIDQDAIFTRATVSQDEIRIGRRSGVTGFNKFGYRTGLTAAAGAETIWATTGNYTPPTSSDTYDITYNATTDGSAGGATGATVLTFFHIDANGLPETISHTLSNTGSDTTTFSGLGINRVAVSASGSSNHNVNNITVTHTTSGNTMAVVPATQSVTQQAIFHVGSNHTAVAKFLWWQVAKPSGGGNAKVEIRGIVFNRAIQTEFEVFRAFTNTSIGNLGQINEPIGFNLGATDVLYFTADTDTNNSEIYLRFSLNEYQNN